MIIVPFSIHDLCNEEERLLPPQIVRERIEHFKCVFHECRIGEVAALRMKRTSELVCAVAALVELHIPFAIISSEDDPVLFGAQWLYDEKELHKISFLERKSTESDGRGCDDLCYTIRTSGTTGEAKLVAVPFSCIEPNIDDFSFLLNNQTKAGFVLVTDGSLLNTQLYQIPDQFVKKQITSHDIILCATSFCFDPSIIELFLSFTSGADLLLVPDHVRSKPHLLASVLRRYKPTIVQSTPSVLSLLDENTLSWIFGSSSPVRCLLLGGEKFPSKLVKRFRSSSNPTRIFNVYGVTEVSCWASIAEIPHSFNNVTIGSPLKCTTISLSEENKVLIGGSRRCCVNGVWNGDFTSTGDTAQVVSGGLAIVGRTDDQVKLNGIRCNLSTISELVQSITHVAFARAVIYKEKFLVLFVKADAPVEDALKILIPTGLSPSKVIYLDVVPVNRNGKVDCSKLLKILEEQCLKDIKTSTSLLAFLSKFGVKADDDLGEHPFTNFEHLFFGIRSLEAAEIALHLRNADALHDILDPNMSISEVLQKYGSCPTEIIDETPSIVLVNIRVSLVAQPNVSWAYDMKKCIDGTPLLTQLSGDDVVTACSHSGLVVCIRVRDGRCLWRTQINTRFEAPVARSGEYFVIGGYDGNVYFLSTLNGNIEWCYECKDVIKAACAVDSMGCVYVPAYDRKLYKLDSKNRKCAWSCSIQSGSPACPLLLERIVVITTIKGSLEAVDVNSGAHVWTFQANGPVFSAVSPHGTSGFVGSVDGTIMKIRLDNGEKELAVNVHEPIFSELTFFKDLIYIVTERGSLFIGDLMLHIFHHFRFDSHRFVVPPIRMSSHTVGIVSSYGSLILFDEDGNRAQAFRLGGSHVFSSPVCLKEKNLVLVGCRDNFLRCFMFPSISG